MMRAAFIALALLAAAPAQAYDCSKALQTAAFKRAVAEQCGYGVNTGELEDWEKSCKRQMTPADIRLHEFTGRAAWAGTRQRFGFPAACKMILRDMRSGFVAD